MAKLYTSRFTNKELENGNYTVVGVVRSMPRFHTNYTIAGNIIQIAPPGYLWNENNREKFKVPYFRHLDTIGYSVLSSKIRGYLNEGKDVVLCCYEDVRKPDEWCHRLVFAEWWNEKTGEIIDELPDQSSVPGQKKLNEIKDKEKDTDERFEQMSFMNDIYRAMYPYYTT